MKRLDPQAIAKSFAAQPEIKPTQGTFYEESDDFTITACDGLARAVMDLGYPPPMEDLDAELALDIPNAYASGFCCGWDGEVMRHSTNAEYAAGHEDGKAAWEATQAALAGRED